MASKPNPVSYEEVACTETGVLTFSSPALATPLSVALDNALADVMLKHDLDDGNSVMALAHRIEPEGIDACKRGYLVGRWRSSVDAEGEVNDSKGNFYGRVINEMGELRGHIRGVWGVPDKGRFAGKKVFFGKYIRRDGQFAGLLAGRYGDGRFGGGWYMRPDLANLHGRLGGHYTAPASDDPDSGYFRGRYASSSCKRRIDEQTLASE